MFKLTRKNIVTLLLVSLIVFTAVGGVVQGTDSTIYFKFNDKSYINFSEQVTFPIGPSKGVTLDDNLIGYWGLNEGSGSIVHDLTSNGNNGTINGATWVEGESGKALSFNGTDYVTIPNSPVLQISNEFTIQAWVKINKLGPNYQGIITKSNEYMLRVENDAEGNHIEFFVLVNGGWREASGHFVPNIGEYYLITGVFDNTLQSGNLKLYINKTLCDLGTVSGSINGTVNPLQIGRIGSNSYLRGIVDEFRIYTKALSANEIVSLFNTASFTDYYSFKDSITYDSILVSAQNIEPNDENTILVTCTNFFSNNRLLFQANNTGLLNLWTSRGQPAFATGIWNSNNCTTTLMVNTSSSGELDWNRNPPSASNLSLSSSITSKTATFSTLWIDNHSLLGGGYIFSTNNTGQWVNASWVPFSSAPYWGNETLTLNNNVGAIIGFREYANNSLNIWANSGLYTITTTNDSSASLPTPSTSSIPTTHPTTSPIPTQLSSPTKSPPPSQSPTPTPLPISTQNNLFSTQTIMVLASVLAVLVVLSVFAFKKGYVTIEVVDEQKEESGQAENQDYNI